MAQTKLQLVLELKDRYSKQIKRMSGETDTATKSIKQRLADVKERFANAGKTIMDNTKTTVEAIKGNFKAASADMKKYLTDPSYRRASVLMAMHDIKKGIEGAKNKLNEAFEDAQKKNPNLRSGGGISQKSHHAWRIGHCGCGKTDKERRRPCNGLAEGHG